MGSDGSWEVLIVGSVAGKVDRTDEGTMETVGKFVGLFDGNTDDSMDGLGDVTLVGTFVI